MLQQLSVQLASFRSAELAIWRSRANHSSAHLFWRRACTFPIAVTQLTTTSPRIPVATYRLQFNSRFRFRDALPVVDYLDDLGISDAYASSYLCAVPGSTHGYDVADPRRLNPEIGDTDEYWQWIGALKARGLGHVLDLVPNHMGIAKSANPWWMDVLENGPSSRYAHFFDIDVATAEGRARDKVLIPTLGDQYGAVLDRRNCTLRTAKAPSSSAISMIGSRWRQTRSAGF